MTIPRAASPPPPDGGYGYVILLMSFLGQALAGTMFVGFGTIIVALVDLFDTTQAQAAIVGAIALAAMNFSAILAGGLTFIFGARPVCIGGAMLCSVALLSTSFVTNIYIVYLTLGVLVGLGSMGIMLTSVVILQQYFEHKRALTTGIASSGMGLGGALAGPIYRLLIDRYGFRSALVAHAALLLQGVVVGAAFRPLDCRKSKQVAIKSETNSDSSLQAKKSSLSKIVDFSLFGNRRYMLYLLVNVCFYYGAVTMSVLSGSRAVSLGFTKLVASLLLSAMSLCSLCSRIVNSVIANCKCTNVFYQFTALSLGSGIALLLVGSTHSVSGSAALAALYGVTFGGFLALMPTVNAELVGIEKVPRAQGLVQVTMGFPGLIALAVGGWIYDKTLNYDITFLVAGTIATFGGCCSCALSVMTYLRQRRETTRISEKEDKEINFNVELIPKDTDIQKSVV